ncbi:hypothetical protein IHN63_00535 [Deinococcus sp. 6YEL10]|uniref:hypothetical protein n=1 Tax=Deinococcus sp. 6YEL10 TaxID=2745870 RepID=UPI001E4F43BC|nr:hypothetical protein [Deinococcus sp. 6YEL10]MCD0159786.1 hypothetical protein [Deinococcus sp. 6YEL10]
MSRLRARLERLRDVVDRTAYDATTQLVGGKVQPLVYLDRDTVTSVADQSWGEFVEAYRARTVRGLFLDRPGVAVAEVIRDLDRDSSVIVIEVRDAERAGLKYLNPDGSLNTSGRFVVAERFPLNFSVTDLVVRHMAGRPWRLVYTVKEAQTHHRIDPAGQQVENLEPRPVNPYGGGW